MTWSPQQYTENGLALGFDPTILQNSIEQIEGVIVPHPELPAILTLKHLATRTGADYEKLRSIVCDSDASYRHFRIRKRSGGYRVISVPEPTLMMIQRWIAKYILNAQPVHHCSFAFRPASSILKCASRHTGARWLVKLDVAGFFGSISEIRVYRVYRSLGYEPLIAFELTRLTTHAPKRSVRYELPEWRARSHASPIVAYWRDRIGYLPQGAPTSPMLSNLIMREADAQIEEVAKKFQLRYTRYSDDLTFSTPSDFDRKRATNLIWKVRCILGHLGLKVNNRKTTIVPPGGRKIVLGLLVDGPRPSLTREFRGTLRQHLYYLSKLGPIEHAKRRGFDSIWGMYRHIRGLVDFAKMIDPNYAEELLKQLDTLEWPNKLA